jgi:hypothetical protein
MRSAALVVSLFVALTSCGSEKIHTYNMGDRVQAGPLVYAVEETHWYPTLGSDPNPRVPVNRFMVVRVNVMNNGATDSGIPTLTLIGDKGEMYNELTDGTGVASWLGVVRRIKPVISEDGNVVFDVPPEHYRLRVADEFEQIESYIDIPLNFVSDEKGQ